MTSDRPLFHRLYGNGIAILPEPIAGLHDVRHEKTLEGEATVKIGNSILSKIFCRILGFPTHEGTVPLSLTMTPKANGERWERLFANHRMVTELYPVEDKDDCIEERVGIISIISRIIPDTQGVTQKLVGIRCMGLPVPNILWPIMDVREGSSDSKYLFNMTIKFPWNSLLIHYEGAINTQPIEKHGQLVS